jgi:hypothetical protein
MLQIQHLKKIASPHAFIENEQWNVFRMKENVMLNM